MVRFFATPQDISEKSILLTAEDSAHIRSLRLRPNEQFVVCNGQGINYVCCLSERQSLDKTREKRSFANIISQEVSISEPSVSCTVFIAYAKGERLDYAVQKSVELGASSIVLFASKRCIAVPNDAHAKTERLQRIAAEAAKQSGRGFIPEVSAVKDFDVVIDVVINTAKNFDLAIMFYEDERELHLMSVLEQGFPLTAQKKQPQESVRTIAIITGPEGGFDHSEIELAKSKDIPIVTLGSRILRSETAPIAALSAIMYHTGNF